MEKEKTTIKRAKVIFVLLAILALVIVLFQFNKNSSITHFVENNSEELMQYAENMIQTANAGESVIYKNFEVTYWKNEDMVEFLVKKKGIGSSNSYEGFYYSPNDKPLGFHGNQVDFIPSESGWMWKESDGDNWEYTEKILKHWYWFEFHF